MMERIFIACGGAGKRVLTTELPKCMLQLPIYQSAETEMILERTFRLLDTKIPVTILTGYGKELVEEAFPGYEYLQTMNVEQPKGILLAIKKVFETYRLDSYTFLLGDVVWSKEALEEMLKTRHTANTTLYHDFREGITETYAITVKWADVQYIYSLLHTPFKSLPAETKHFGLIETPLSQCRIGHLDSLLRTEGHGHSIVKQTAAVEDVDTDKQYRDIKEHIKSGIFDVPPIGTQWMNLKNTKEDDYQVI